MWEEAEPCTFFKIKGLERSLPLASVSLSGSKFDEVSITQIVPCRTWGPAGWRRIFP